MNYGPHFFPSRPVSKRTFSNKVLQFIRNVLINFIHLYFEFRHVAELLIDYYHGLTLTVQVVRNTK